VEVSDQLEDLLRRRFDGRRPLDSKRVGPSGRDQENDGDEEDDNSDDREHGFLRSVSGALDVEARFAQQDPPTKTIRGSKC
jgi:hypothetical protein